MSTKENAGMFKRQKNGKVGKEEEEEEVWILTSGRKLIRILCWFVQH